MTQQHGLNWGALDFVDPDPTADGYVLEAMADGTDLGNPAAVVEVIQSLLGDGSLATVQRYDNREIPIRIRISAPTAPAGPALAAGEAALQAEASATTLAPLLFLPPADGALTCAFDVVLATLERDTSEGWDLDEVQQECRYFMLTLACLPFARESGIHVSFTNVLAGKQGDNSTSDVVGGTAPTSGAVRLFHTTPGQLGTASDVLIYTEYGDFSGISPLNPALRTYRVSSATVTADAARRSGSRNPLSSAMVFRFPAASLEGTYAVMALVNVPTAGDLTWSARLVALGGATTISSGVTVGQTSPVTATAGAYRVVSLGSEVLPPAAYDADADLYVELTLTGPSDTIVDDVFLFSHDRGAVTWVGPGALSTSVNWVEVRSPELDAPRPSVYAGNGTVGTEGECIDYACEAFGRHRFMPGDVLMFASSDVAGMSMNIRYYPRYHTFVS